MHSIIMFRVLVGGSAGRVGDSSLVQLGLKLKVFAKYYSDKSKVAQQYAQMFECSFDPIQNLERY